MSSERSTISAPPRKRAATRRPAAEAGAEPALLETIESELDAEGWDSIWDLGQGRVSPPVDPGDRHLQQGVAEIVRDAALDAFALSTGGPRTALVLGCGEGWLAQQLLSWGADWVVGVDQRQPALRRGELLAEYLSIDPRRLRLSQVGCLEQLGLEADENFSIVVAPAAWEAQAQQRGALLAVARRHASHRIAVETADRNRTIREFRETGVKPIRTDPPTDAERRLILGERAVLVAAPGGNGE